MRLYTFEHEHQLRLGAEWKTQLLDLATADRLRLERKPPSNPSGLKRLPPDLRQFLQLGTAAFEAAHEALAFAAKRPAIPMDERLTYSFDEVTLRAPLPQPGKILCSSGCADWFAKMPSTVIGPGASIVQPFVAHHLECEPRLGALLGKRCRNELETEIMGCVAGFTIINDISARMVESANEPALIRKNFDTFCPTGPCILTTDELAALSGAEWRVSVNGKTVQIAAIANTIALIPGALRELCRVMTLEPGDFVALALSADGAIALKSGDVVALEIDGIGTLRNCVTLDG